MSEPSRVAPTAKIPDDAPFPPHYGGSPMPVSKAPASIAPNGPTTLSPPTYSPASIPPQNNGTGPASIPPQNAYGAGPASIPPQNNYITGPASVAPSSRNPASIPPTNNPYPPTDLGFGKPVPPRQMAEPSMSMPAAMQPRWGLIIVILVLDVALAAAGGVMLSKGLAKADAPTTTPAKAADTAKPVEPPTAQPAAETPEKKDVAASIMAAANGSGSGSPVAASDADTAPKPKTDAPKQAATKSKAGGAPQDPYADPPAKNVSAEIELAMVRSKADLAYCQEDVGAVHGRIDIQFTVLPTGAVDDLKILKNSTGSQALATCLVGVMTKWAFATKPTAPTNFVRPFIY